MSRHQENTFPVEVIRVDGTIEQHQVRLRSPFVDIHKLLGCTMCDSVNLKDGRVMLVDDTGMVDGKPVNPKATEIYHSIRNTPYSIHGDVAIAMDEEFA